LDGNDIYLPKEKYEIGRGLVFPALDWQKGEVIDTRTGKNPEFGEFQVIQVEFQVIQVQFKEGPVREFASRVEDHILNEPLETTNAESLDVESVLKTKGELLVGRYPQ